MAKKQKHGRLDEERDGERKAMPAPERVFSSPFKDLKKMIVESGRTAATTPPPVTVKATAPIPAKPVVEKPAQPPAEPIDDESFFRQALEGVRPLHANGKRRSR